MIEQESILNKLHQEHELQIPILEKAKQETLLLEERRSCPHCQSKNKNINKRGPMKKTIALLSLFAFFSCSVKTPEPKLSDIINGTYNVYYVESSGQSATLPVDDISMTIEILKVRADKSNYILTSSVGEQKNVTNDVFELKKNGEEIELYNLMKRVGYVRGISLECNVEGYLIKAKK